jgi:hypothetical protein
MPTRPLSNARSVAIPNDFIQQFTGAPDSEKTLPPHTRGLLVENAGTLDVTMTNGVARTDLPFVVGINPGSFKSIQSGGTALNIWAVI